MAINGGERWREGCQVYMSGRRREDGWYLLQESVAEIEMSEISLHIETRECVGVEEADITEPLSELRLVLPPSPLHGIILS